jgi:hypothetical protein
MQNFRSGTEEPEVVASQEGKARKLERARILVRRQGSRRQTDHQ